jgi:hypothetical protein
MQENNNSPLKTCTYGSPGGANRRRNCSHEWVGCKCAWLLTRVALRCRAFAWWCLIVFTGLIQCCNVTNSVVPFFPFQGFFVGATSLVLQHQLSQFLHVLHTQPSSRTFWLMALSVNSINSVGRLLNADIDASIAVCCSRKRVGGDLREAVEWKRLSAINTSIGWRKMKHDASNDNCYPQLFGNSRITSLYGKKELYWWS